MTSYSAPGPLNVGNLVSSAFSVYRSNFKRDIGIAIKAYLWILVPVYGWAKFAMLSGLISRLAYQDIINKPETESNARNILKPRFWTFLSAAINVIIRGIFIYLFLAVLTGIISTVLMSLLGPLAVAIPPFFFLAVLFYFLWITARWSVTELPIAVENMGADSAIGRSSDLTKGSVLRVQLVLFLASLITYPLFVVMLAIPGFFMTFAKDGSSLSLILTVIYYLSCFVSGILIMPFWQIVKALLYYDLRSRKEGVDLKLRA
jgi:hypothetical protein